MPVPAALAAAGDPPSRGRVPELPPLPPLVDRTGPAQTVLIAEDHADSRDALKTLLDAFGYVVHEAFNGRDAVEKALTVQPDLVLMDMMMPEMDGFQATRVLRADERFRQVPIIALTAMEGARERVLAAGCNDMVTKPIDVRVFLDRVRTWLASGRAMAS